MKNLDSNLIEQYLTILGREGIQDSYKSFVEVVPGYIEELDNFNAARDSSGLRKQAHKIKGACRSLGFVRLAGHMEYLEKEAWGWADVEKRMQAWEADYPTDTLQLEDWLNA